MIDNIINKNVGGIDLVFIPKKEYIEKQAMICFNYGSSENNIVVEGKNINLPPGIAHFLEHKIFEDKEYNVFEVFNKLGGNVNAFTNLTTTAYYFNTVDNFYENFKELLKFVSRPYFTDENVEREKGIIEQEIKMYDDDPYWKVYFNLLSTMYDSKNPITKDIAGSVSDIKKIDKDMLYTCYNNFYTKDNGKIICCGDIDDLARLEDIINSSLTINNKKCGIVQEYVENIKSEEKSVEKTMAINQKIFNIGFKSVEKYDNIEKQILSYKLFLDIIFGTASEFYEKLYNKGIIDNSFGFDFNSFQGFSLSVFSGISENPKEIIKYIKDEVYNFRNKSISEKDFNRIKNKHIGNFIKQFNIINSIVSMEADFFSRGFNIQSYYETLKGISLETLEYTLKNFDDNAYLSTIV